MRPRRVDLGLTLAVDLWAANQAIGAARARSAGGFVVFEGRRFRLVLLLDRFDRLVLFGRNFRLDLDGFDFDELRRLVDAFIVGMTPLASLGKSAAAFLACSRSSGAAHRLRWHRPE